MHLKVFLYEKQLEMPGGATYFPFASGLLVAYAKKFLSDWTFKINEPAEDPDIAAFSVSLWNKNYCLNKAQQIKDKYPECRLVFGGPSVDEVKHLEGAEIIDGEGEAAFLKSVGIDAEIKELDDIPSPYLSGVFDGINGTQAIVETNRGCPFGCAYCFWGKGSKRVKFHSMEYVKAEAEWIGINKIPYVFCADGNFGMFSRDPEIARIYADAKKKYGYPEKFRVCYGKNAEESVFETASILAEAGLSKSVTLSPQTRNQKALEIIGRKNIRNDYFDKMQERYENAGIPVYSELILGLPGETYESFKDGLLQTMKSGNQLFVYLCECLPGTKLADPEFMKENGIITRNVLMTPVHCRPVFPQEYEDIVVGTRTMSTWRWKNAAVLSWMVQLFYSFKILDAEPEEILTYCIDQMTGQTVVARYFEDKADDILTGRGRCDLINGIYFEPEEVMYLKYFKTKGDPVENVIYARKSNFKKKEVNACT
jgi:radical SAM superfamily enzyme YgiQ (UPF0313 family)